jgi:hypothetical protein
MNHKFNADFTIEECGGSGDCLFHVFAIALSRLTHSRRYSMVDIRKILANSINEDNLDMFHKYVMIDMNHLAVPSTLNNIQNLVKTSGWKFIGSDSVIRWLIGTKEIHAFNIGVVIFSTHGPHFTSVIDLPDTLIYLLIYNKSNLHWQLAKYKNFSFVSKSILDLILKYFSEDK